MTDLIDRIIGSDGAEKINVHHFIGQYTLVSEAIRTPQEVVGEFNLTGDEVAQAQLVLDVLDGKSNVLSKLRYLAKLDSVFVSIEAGDSRYWPNGDDSPADKATIALDLEIS